MVKDIRKKRLGALIQRGIADLVLREIKDPRLEGVSITDVAVSDDLMDAKVYFFVHQGANVKKVLKGFESAKGFLRAELGNMIRMRRVPDLTFVYDDTLDLFERIKTGDEDKGGES